MCTKTITHDGLHTYRVVRGTTQEETEVKARLQMGAWNERWKASQDAAAARQERLTKRGWADRPSDHDRRAKDRAIELTKDAEAAVLASRSLLVSALKDTPSLEWESLKDNSAFERPQPSIILGLGLLATPAGEPCELGAP
jgi:restriction system protein